MINPWTEEADELLIRMYERGDTLLSIRGHLGRTRGAVDNRLRLLKNRGQIKNDRKRGGQGMNAKEKLEFLRLDMSKDRDSAEEFEQRMLEELRSHTEELRPARSEARDAAE